MRCGRGAPPFVIRHSSLKLGRVPAPSALTLAPLPSISLIPFARLKLARCPHSLGATLRTFTFYLAHPIRSIETRSLPRSLGATLRTFTFYLAHPIRSIRHSSFCLFAPRSLLPAPCYPHSPFPINRFAKRTSHFAAEFFLQFGQGNLNHGGTAVGTTIG